MEAVILLYLSFVTAVVLAGMAGFHTIDEVGDFLASGARNWVLRPIKSGWRLWARWIQPRSLQELASDLGFELQAYRFSSFRMKGRRSGLVTELLCRPGRSLLVAVEQPTIPTTLKLARLQPGQQTTRPTGDPSFDSEVILGGDDAIAHSLLDQETRKKVQELIELGGRVESSQVKILLPDPGKGPFELVEQGARMLEFAVDLAHRLTVEGPLLPKRLAHNAATEKLSTVRLQNLLTLMRHFPQHPECLGRCHSAFSDPSGEVRWQAADFLLTHPGSDPATIVEASAVLTDLVRRPGLPEDLRKRALKSLSTDPLPEATRGNLLEMLEELLTKEKGTILTAAIGLIGELRLRGFLPRLLELIPDADLRLTVSLARAFGRFGDPQAQSALLGMLENDDATVLQEAAKALGDLGDAGAVESLLRLTRRGKKPLNDAALEAVSRIQSRLLGAELGQLSLAAAAELEGALSPTGLAGPGDLSLAEAAPPAPAPCRVAEGS